MFLFTAGVAAVNLVHKNRKTVGLFLFEISLFHSTKKIISTNTMYHPKLPV